jgi:hypothetical protein
MAKLIECLNQKEMIGATITNVEYNSDRMIITTDKGLICVANVSYDDDDWYDNYVYLQPEINIGYCGESGCYIDIDEAFDLGLVDEEWKLAYNKELEREETIQKEKYKMQRVNMLKDELAKLEGEN